MAFVPEDRRAVSREGESALLGKHYIRLPFAEGVSMMRVIVFFNHVLSLVQHKQVFNDRLCQIIFDGK